MNKKNLIEGHLRKLFPSKDRSKNFLKEASAYVLHSSGKRLRPLLVLQICEYYGTPLKKALDAACALELLHTFSLVHDDLPCMDNDSIRRGKPTLHTLYNEASALLVGNFLCTEAFLLITNAKSLKVEEKAVLCRLLAACCGTKGLMGGQLLDLQSSQDIDLKAVLSIYHKKTAMLFATSFLFGGVLANASPRELQLLRKLGISFGLYYQLLDDIQDLEDDRKNGKITIATNYPLEASRLCSLFEGWIEKYCQELFTNDSIFLWLKGSLKIEKKGIVAS